MADGDNLIIGMANQGDAETRLNQSGPQVRLGFAVSNTNGSGIFGEADDPSPVSAGVVGHSRNGIGVVADGTTIGLRSQYQTV
jgi:hypothetical protein